MRIGTHRTVALALLALLGGAGIAGAEARRAVLVGIDEYVPRSAEEREICRNVRQPDGRWRNLCGAVSDVQAMRGILISHFGFRGRDIRVLTDRQATRKNILDALDWLATESGPDDVAFFQYSGHGSRVRYVLDGERREDQTLVPVDSPDGSRDIGDKELRMLLRRIPLAGAHLTTVFDSCHSGSITRDPMMEGAGPTRSADSRSLGEPPPWASPGECAEEDGEGCPTPEELGALRLSAARDWQTAKPSPRDCYGRPRSECHGAFTRALVKAIRTSPPDESARRLFLRARAFLKAGGDVRSQDPVIVGEARKDRPLLGVGTASDVPHPVVAVERELGDGGYLLDGGAAVGVHPGAVLRLADAEGARAALRVEVTASLGVNRSRARVASGEGGLEPGRDLLVVERWAPGPREPLRLWVPEIGLDDAALEAHRTVAAAIRALEGAVWVSEPTEIRPTHLVRWREDGWELRDEHGAARSGLDREALLGALRGAEAPRVFLEVPPPASLREALALSEESLVAPARSRAEADYLLVGRLADGGAEWAWMRPGQGEDDAQEEASVAPDTALPSHSTWTPLQEDGAKGAAAVLRGDARELGRIAGWLALESPGDERFPYRLEVRQEGLDPGKGADGSADTWLVEAERPVKLVLGSAGPPSFFAERYVYVFGLKTTGERVPVFPLGDHGGDEHKISPPLPPATPSAVIEPEGMPPIEFDCDEEGCGTGTFFLLTTDAPLSDPGVLAGRPVLRSRGPEDPPIDPLTQLLDDANRGVRSRGTTPTSWSISRIHVRSRPATE